jgi:four helix bundle protein
MTLHAPNPTPRTAGLAGLDAYQVALDFYRLLVGALRNAPKGHVTDQICRAAESVVLNVAEAHPALGADRARRFRIAFNEASECGAALDLLEIRGRLGGPALSQLRALLDRERAMLYRLSRPGR